MAVARLFRIDTPADVPLARMRVNLGGTDFSLRLDYTEKEDSWYLSVYTANESPIIRGVKLRPNRSLLTLATSDEKPQGFLVLVGPPVKVGFAALGRTHTLYFGTHEAARSDFVAASPGV